MLYGVGAGLEPEQIPLILDEQPSLPWFAVEAGPHLGLGGANFRALLELRERYPLAFFCDGLSLGSTDPLNDSFIERLVALVERVDPETLVDDLGWRSVNHRYLHHSLPLPYTDEAVGHVAARIREVQYRFERPLLVRNPPIFFRFAQSTLSECQFVCAVLDEAECYLALDLSALALNARSLGFDPGEYLAALPLERVSQLRISRYATRDGLWPPPDQGELDALVEELFDEAIGRFGPQPTALDWDRRRGGLDRLRSRIERLGARVEARGELA
ncbi:MAG: DUF692 family protein [Myxococcales bacterium]|nr:DUF692 family protein [Myxococcales bacterium]